MASRPPTTRRTTLRPQRVSSGPRSSTKGRTVAARPARWGRWALVAWLLLVVWLSVEYVRLPDVRPLRTTLPRTTSLMAQRAEEARAEKRRPRQRQSPVALANVAPHAVAAVLVSEDARFHQHGGVDWVEVRSVVNEALEERRLGRGASTLTQQLAKNLYLSTDRSLLRKARELVLARRLEAELGKQRILALYVNVVEWGDGVYGIEAAAREHFGTSARELTVAQGAMLAGMLPAPRRWLPAQRPPVLRARATVIVDRLEQAGRITPEQAVGARAELSRFYGEPEPPSVADIIARMQEDGAL